jgi:hypothetical protein
MEINYAVLIETPNMIWEKIFPHNREGLDKAFETISSAIEKNNLISAEITSSRDGRVYFFEK